MGIIMKINILVDGSRGIWVVSSMSREPCGAVWCRGAQGLLLYMLQLYFHYLISTFSEPCYNSTPKSHTNPKKSNYHPKKSKKSKKSKKKNKKKKKKKKKKK